VNKSTTTWKSDWEFPPPRHGLAGSWDRFIGPGATAGEQLLSLIPAVTFAGAVAVYAYVERLLWSPWQYLVAVLLAFDIIGGIATNATSAAKRWYHRPSRSSRQHFGFAALHVVYIFLVAWLFCPHFLGFFVFHSTYLLVSALIVLAVSPYLERATALLLLCAGILLSLYVVVSPAGLEWFPPFLYLKLLVSHLVREEPYSSQTSRS
jgi:hypothetical protein